MKKRILSLLLIAGMITAGCGNQEMSEMPESQISEEAAVEDTENIAENVESTEENETEEEEGKISEVAESKEAAFSFAEFENLEFYFASGAGGWRTVMQIENDGSFYGQFSDSDMGSVGEGYPNGTVYLSEFEGKFTEPVKVNDYTYSMEVEEINYGEKFDTEEIIDGILYCYGDAYGLAGAEEILIYLPGAPTNELPEAYMSWVRNTMENPETLELPFYGLYNVKEENGFSSYDIGSRIDDLIASTEQWSDTVKASLENDPLSQTDMNIKSKELYDMWDAALNTLWDSLKEKLPENEFSVLLDEQRAWIKEKEAAVEAEGAELEGGSLQPLVMNMKAAEMTEERVYELYEFLP